MCSVQHLIKEVGALGLRAGRRPCISGAPQGCCAFSSRGRTPIEESATGRHPSRGIKIFHGNWFDSAYSGGVGVANTRRAGH